MSSKCGWSSALEDFYGRLLFIDLLGSLLYFHPYSHSRHLELLRQSVLLQEAVRFKVASNSMATVGPNHGTGIGLDNEMRNIKGNQPVHPMFRNLASQVGLIKPISSLSGCFHTLVLKPGFEKPFNL